MSFNTLEVRVIAKMKFFALSPEFVHCRLAEPTAKNSLEVKGRSQLRERSQAQGLSQKEKAVRKGEKSPLLKEIRNCRRLTP